MAKKKQHVPLDKLRHFKKGADPINNFYSFKNHAMEALYDLRQEGGGADFEMEVTDELNPYMALLHPSYEDNFHISMMGLLCRNKQQLRDYLRKVDRYVKPKNNDDFYRQLKILAAAYLSRELHKQSKVSFNFTEYVFHRYFEVTESLIQNCRVKLAKLEPHPPFIELVLTTLLFYVLQEEGFNVAMVEAKQPNSTRSRRNKEHFAAAYLAYKQTRWQEMQSDLLKKQRLLKNSSPSEEEMYLLAGMLFGLILNPDVFSLV